MFEVLVGFGVTIIRAVQAVWAKAPGLFRFLVKSPATPVAILFLGIVIGVLVTRVNMEHRIRQGGLDLKSYCGEKMSVDGESCTVEINEAILTSACNWRYPDQKDVGVYTSGSPDSGDCRALDSGRSLGGIDNLGDYCNNAYSGSRLHVSASASRYSCSMKIDMNKACGEKYHYANPKAIKEDSGWACY
ncbi:hypothetical protein ACFYTQ_21080 [Nocardia sp. NPDC004068]|uniref:hypothetical protein n=1 Tax=Nocardia sp. NPDC004068 TaxID=3364303 RepID=UPI003696DB47